MTILVWILAILAAPVVVGIVWLAWTFVREFIRYSREGEPLEPAEYVLPAEAAALGLLPQDQQNTELAGPEPAELTTAVAAAKAGDWQPAAALLHETGQDWERRTLFAWRLAKASVEDDGWLLAWEDARPDDPDAAVVRTRSTVALAWDIRGAKRATYTTAEQFDGFHRTLARSREHTARAAALAPDDPTPYVNEIWTALGLSYPHAEMDRIWNEITARAPYHYEAHFSALQYWCAKWRGSEQLAHDFAERAAAGAPLGSLLTALPLIAWFEHHDDDATEEDYRTPGLIALVDAALADTAAAPADHPRLVEVRHLLAYFLTMQDRDEASVEQFLLVDGYIGGMPWSHHGSPAKRYCWLRDLTVKNAAALTG
ncbi:hypothetical protein [Streptomyces sp. AK02-01A]|uniref:hypothetical protein n=1 Tax=Streptomyces sp. AK02-01A TaxID=3028648 RepID=UPI0029B6E587|nr:hypothetical protein [Streptomyces sp. AK02-01A]MDX3854145.1 hypothetical protein [Streptomyces sp. AK02-01A]